MTEEWDDIVRQHTAAVIRAAWRILGNTTDAEDVAQDVFLEALQSCDATAVRNWSSYLRRMAVCRAIDRLRRRRRSHLLDEKSVLPSDQPSPHDLASANELEARLRESLATLPPRESQVFSLRCFEDLSNKEIAELLAMTPGAVGVALSKARAKLEAMIIESQKGANK